MTDLISMIVYSHYNDMFLYSCLIHTVPFVTPSGYRDYDICLFGIEGPVEPFINCARRPCFRASALGIGYSFQLAITTPRINLIGYGTATAQT